MALKFLDIFKMRTAQKPRSPEAAGILARARTLQREGQSMAATAAYQSILELDPGNRESSMAIAALALQGREFDRAVQLCDALILQNGDFAEAYYKRANALNGLGRLEAALGDYNRAIELDPGYANAYCNRGAVLERLSRWEEALASLDQALALNPADYLAHANAGSVLRKLQRFEEALQRYDRAISFNDNYVEAYFYRASVLQDLRRYEAAVASYDRAIELTPGQLLPYVAYSSRGIALVELKRFDEALVSFNNAIALKVDYTEAYVNRGNVLRELRQDAAAVASYDEAIKLDPDGFLAYCNRGSALKNLKRLAEALASYDKSIERKSDYAEAYYNRGIVLQELRRYEAAVGSYDEARKFTADDRLLHLVHANRGYALSELKRFEEALISFEAAIACRSDDAQAYMNHGNILQELRRYEAAAASYAKVLALEPDDVTMHLAYCGRGFALKELNRFDEALVCYEQAIALNDHDVEVFMNYGGVLQALGRHEAAIAGYERAIALKPDYVEAFAGRGFSFLNLRQHEAAIASFDKAIALNPHQKYLAGFRRYAQMQICDWDDLDDYLDRLTEGLRAGSPVTASFQVLALVDSAPLHRLAAEIWTREECPPDHTLGAIETRLAGDKIRVGYFSADFRDHPVSLLAAGLFETHDRSRFEVTAFAFGPPANDAMRARLEHAFDRFIDVRGRSDTEVAGLARSIGIDIAVDLGGFTEGARPRIFALRSAPIQVGYLGYLGTMGAPYMDYMVADAELIPAGRQPEYAEKIIYLPSYQVNDAQRRISERKFTREELGLPPLGFVFCCLNANYKIMPVTFGSWMRILARVAGSSLFLFADNQIAQRNLLEAARRYGIDPHRVVFGQRLAREEYLARFRTMDLFLDTLPYNAGTTASDALWAGLPVLTCEGDAFSGRVAASVLKALHLPELVTATSEQYEDLAVHLATHPASLQELRRKLAHNRHVAPLFDTASFTKTIEYAYSQIYERYRANLPAEHVYPDR